MKKVLVITGGSRGIGFATCQHFQNQGYQVINLSRSKCNLKDVIHLPADLSQVSAILEHQTTLQQHIENADKVVLVHCAAGHTADTIHNADTNTLINDLAINIIAPTTLTQMLLPLMPKGSAVIYIGSTLSEKAVPGCYSYVTSKHAVIGMMRSVCQDLAGKYIHTTCICPGFTDTEMMRGHIGYEPEIEKSITQNITFGRFLEPKEIAETIYFSANTPAINGSVIHANLGQIER